MLAHLKIQHFVKNSMEQPLTKKDICIWQECLQVKQAHSLFLKVFNIFAKYLKKIFLLCIIFKEIIQPIHSVQRTFEFPHGNRAMQFFLSDKCFKHSTLLPIFWILNICGIKKCKICWSSSNGHCHRPVVWDYIQQNFQLKHHLMIPMIKI